MRRVPLNDLVRQNRLVQEELGVAARCVIERGWYVLGSECTDFETAFADYCAVSHCIGVANGTDAIDLALRALGVAGGDGVATVANAGGGADPAPSMVGDQGVPASAQRIVSAIHLVSRG